MMMMMIKDWYFITKFFTFIQCCLLNLSIAYNMIIFNNGEVTDVLAWPPNDFYAMKNVCTENIQLRKIT